MGFMAEILYLNMINRRQVFT